MQLTKSGNIAYDTLDIPANSYIRLRVSGIQQFDSYPSASITEADMDTVIRINNPTVLRIVAVTNGQKETFKNTILSALDKTKCKRIKQIFNSIYGVSSNPQFMFLEENNNYIAVSIGLQVNQPQYRMTGKNGLEILSDPFLFTKFKLLEVTKLEYKVIEASDIKPTDYKLNFD